jgi:glucose/arabinose dehydrogenase
MNKLDKIIPAVLLVFAVSAANCQEIPAGNNIELFASGVDRPVCITNSGDTRLFVVDQAGAIIIVTETGNVNAEPFLDIAERVVYGGERGLLGLAFHPDYENNGYFYVNYTGEGDSTHISRFTVSSGNPDIADPESEFSLMTIFQPYSNHNGGDLCFGPDGFLYIGLGDGGAGGDPGNRSQNPMEYLGKMLRIDVNQGNPYAIPTSNPFYNEAGTLGEIWALGLRNPWRFSFDRLNGDLWIADVGQNVFEEINFQPGSGTGGENYGWRCYEGNAEYNTAGCASASAYTFPVHTYAHGPECSVTGGYVFRGNESSPFYGHYFFADYCSDKIWTLHNVSGEWIPEEFGQFSGNNFSTFGEDVSGQLYVAGLSSGSIFRVVGNSTGIGQPGDFPGFKIIQSPNSRLIRVETDELGPFGLNFLLYDIHGVINYTDTVRAANFEFDPGPLPSGVYFLKIMNDGNSFVHKLFIRN